MFNINYMGYEEPRTFRMGGLTGPLISQGENYVNRLVTPYQELDDPDTFVLTEEISGWDISFNMNDFQNDSQVLELLGGKLARLRSLIHRHNDREDRFQITFNNDDELSYLSASDLLHALRKHGGTSDALTKAIEKIDSTVNAFNPDIDNFQDFLANNGITLRQRRTKSIKVGKHTSPKTIPEWELSITYEHDVIIYRPFLIEIGENLRNSELTESGKIAFVWELAKDIGIDGLTMLIVYAGLDVNQIMRHKKDGTFVHNTDEKLFFTGISEVSKILKGEYIINRTGIKKHWISVSPKQFEKAQEKLRELYSSHTNYGRKYMKNSRWIKSLPIGRGNKKVIIGLQSKGEVLYREMPAALTDPARSIVTLDYQAPRDADKITSSLATIYHGRDFTSRNFGLDIQQIKEYLSLYSQHKEH